jgi:hypothetical protein
MSSRASAAAAAGSARSWASMKRSSRARSSALGAEAAAHSDGRAGNRSRRVARARWSALLAAATVVSSSDAVSPAGQPSTSRRSSTARCHGGRSWMTARNVSSMVSLATTTASGWVSLGATWSSSRSG